MGSERWSRTRGGWDLEGGRGKERWRPVDGEEPLMLGKAAALLKMVRVNAVGVMDVGRTWCCQDCKGGKGKKGVDVSLISPLVGADALIATHVGGSLLCSLCVDWNCGWMG